MYNVIIVEDEVQIAHLNKYYLHLVSKELQVTALFVDGKKALDYLKQYPVDLILLDVYMPNFSGLELLQAIRSLHIPVDVIMLTAAKEAEEVAMAFQLGIVDYLVKPFDFSRFRQAIQKFLHKQATLNSTEPLNQKTIDTMERPQLEEGEPPLKKGLQVKTMEKVMAFINTLDDSPFTVKSLADGIGLSIVTTQRYVNYLVDSGFLSTTIDYNTGGRPKMIYQRTMG